MAILLVLLYHYITLAGSEAQGAPLSALQRVFAMGWAGVDLFFVLSGFLIGGILLDARESPGFFQTFYARRFFRIIPLYAVWVGMFFLLALLSFPGFPAAIRDNPERWTDARFYVVFLQNSFRIPHAVFGTAWLGGLWSLAVEEQFYLVIPMVVRFFPRRRLVEAMGLAVVLAPLTRMALRTYLPQHGAAPYMLTVCRADALALGVLFACMLRDERWRSGLLRHGKKLACAMFPDSSGSRRLSGGMEPIAILGYDEPLGILSTRDIFRFLAGVCRSTSARQAGLVLPPVSAGLPGTGVLLRVRHSPDRESGLSLWRY